MGRGAKRLPYGKLLVRVPAVAKFLFDMIFNVNVLLERFETVYAILFGTESNNLMNRLSLC